MKTIGDRIRQARTALGMSADTLAHKVGYKTQSGISNLENKASGSGGNKIAKIAQVLDVSVDWLLNGPDGISIPFLSQQPRSPLSTAEPTITLLPQRDDLLKAELLSLWGQLNDNAKREWIGDLRRFVREKSPHHYGADPAMAEK